MIDISNKEKCCGCHACYSSCPMKCISMEADEEGFLYPRVDETKCIQCGLCEKVCLMQNNCVQAPTPNAYAAYALDDNIRLHSSSGGIFTLLAKYVINKGGVVCGAAFQKDTYSVNHIFIETVEAIKLLRTSKYVQSYIGDCYKEAKQYLDDGRIVLFTGTPCQINGLKKYLGKDYDNLLCQDIICHGVPSEKMWKKYLSYLEKRKNSKVVYQDKPCFRDKSESWTNFSMTIPLEKDTYRCVVYKDPYLRGFIHNLYLRPSCYACQSKGLSRNADITLADFWGVNKYCPEMYDEKGVSLVMIYTEKGQEIWKAIESEIERKDVAWQDAIKGNPSAIHSVTKPKAREFFYDKVNESNFGKLVEKYTKPQFVIRIVKKMKRIIKI